MGLYVVILLLVQAYKSLGYNTKLLNLRAHYNDAQVPALWYYVAIPVANRTLFHFNFWMLNNRFQIYFNFCITAMITSFPAKLIFRYKTVVIIIHSFLTVCRGRGRGGFSSHYTLLALNYY